MQYEPTISCSCGVGAEKACWHRAIVSLCCQAPGQSDNDSLDPPFQTLFSLREMQRFIENTTGADGAGVSSDLKKFLLEKWCFHKFPIIY